MKGGENKKSTLTLKRRKKREVKINNSI